MGTDDRTSRNRNSIINRNCIYTRRSSIYDRKQIFIRWDSENWAAFTRLINSPQRGRCILNRRFIQSVTLVSFRLGWMKWLPTLRWWKTRQRSICYDSGGFSSSHFWVLLRLSYAIYRKTGIQERLKCSACEKYKNIYRESWLQTLLFLLLKN